MTTERVVKITLDNVTEAKRTEVVSGQSFLFPYTIYVSWDTYLASSAVSRIAIWSTVVGADTVQMQVWKNGSDMSVVCTAYYGVGGSTTDSLFKVLSIAPASGTYFITGQVQTCTLTCHQSWTYDGGTHPLPWAEDDYDYAQDPPTDAPPDLANTPVPAHEATGIALALSAVSWTAG